MASFRGLLVANIYEVGIAPSVQSPGYELDDRGSLPGGGSDGILFSSPLRPDRL
jgi:hypothetical protein